MNSIAIALLGLLSFLLSLMAQLAPAQVRPEEATYRVEPSAVTTIAVFLENATDVYGIDVRASYDPELVEVVDADLDRDGLQVEAGQFPQPDFVAVSNANPQTGTVHYVVTQLNPTLPATGSGIVFLVRLRGRGIAGTSEFRIEHVEISSRDGDLLPVQWSAATIETAVTGALASEAQPTGVALAPTVAVQPAPSASPSAPATLTPEPSEPSSVAPAQPAVSTQTLATADGSTLTITAPPPAASGEPPSADEDTPATGATLPTTAAPNQSIVEATAATDATAEPQVAGATAAPADAIEPSQDTTDTDPAVSEAKEMNAVAVIGQNSGPGANTQTIPATGGEDANRSGWVLALALGTVITLGAILLRSRRSG